MSIRNLITNPKFSENIAVVEQQPGRRDDDDNYIPGVETQTSMKAVTSPLTPDHQHLVREGTGARQEDYRVFYVADDRIRSLRSGTQQTAGDCLIYEGLRWDVDSVEYWPKFGFSVVLAIRQSGQSG